MRTSNKILSATFIAILLIITGVHVALYAKYKSGDFITMTHLHEELYDSYSLKGIQTVSLTGLQNVKIIPSDTARLEIEKHAGDTRLIHQFANGMLTIKGDTVVSKGNGSTERIRNYTDIIIYLPASQDIKADYCEIRLLGSEDSTKAPSLIADMTRTQLHLGSWDREDEFKGDYFNKISVTKFIDGSIEMSGKMSVKEAGLDLQTSDFSDNGATLGTVSITADSISTIKLNGRNFAKTKITLK